MGNESLGTNSQDGVPPHGLVFQMPPKKVPMVQGFQLPNPFRICSHPETVEGSTLPTPYV